MTDAPGRATPDEIDRMIRTGRWGTALEVGDLVWGSVFRHAGDGKWIERTYNLRGSSEAEATENDVRACIAAAPVEKLVTLRAALGGPATPDEIDRMIAAAIAGADLDVSSGLCGNVYRCKNGTWEDEEYEKGSYWTNETSEAAVRKALARATPETLDELRFLLGERGKEIDRMIAAARAGTALQVGSKVYRLEKGNWVVERVDDDGVRQTETTSERSVRHQLAVAGPQNLDRLRVALGLPTGDPR